jgi:hypothetical protein
MMTLRTFVCYVNQSNQTLGILAKGDAFVASTVGCQIDIYVQNSDGKVDCETRLILIGPFGLTPITEVILAILFV